MAQIFTIAERRISGTGLIVPSTTQLYYRRYTLFADIIRKPRTPYISTDSSPFETYYGVISLMKNDYCLQTYKIKYDAQIWNFDADITGQVINTIKCVYISQLQAFIDLRIGLQLNPITVVNAIADFKNLPLEWDSIRVKCFADCAIAFTLKAIEYDACNEADKVPSNPPTVPAKPTQVNPGTPIAISPAYSNDTITSPAAIDLTYVPPPVGIACQQGKLTFNMQYTSDGVPKNDARQAFIRGQVGTYKIVGTKLQWQFQGFNSEGCKAFAYYDLINMPSGTVITGISNIVYV